ncbi:MAG TPA: TlyA family RNA methyltransferase [Gaiellales bacterium]|nr:TlyA family RNA methyltransferase [Gaiellales bacterium]
MRGSTRLDVLMAERGIAESRSRAQALIMAGRVLVEGAVVTKAGTPVAPSAAVELVAPPRYVSRGGEKLETALAAFAVDVAGLHCLDVGSSTGGFTDCLLQHGAAHVVCVDVGRNQLHERLRADARVTVMEGVNARRLEPAMLPYPPALVTADVSFISLRLVLPPVLGCAAPVWRALVLVKPQFEVGKGETRRGVVRDPEVRRRVLREFSAFAAGLGAVVLGVCDSCVPGPAGNREYVVDLAAAGHPAAQEREPDVERAIADAVASA